MIKHKQILLLLGNQGREVKLARILCITLLHAPVFCSFSVQNIAAMIQAAYLFFKKAHKTKFSIQIYLDAT